MVFSVLLGSGTHLLWDAFTHQGTFITSAWSWTEVELARFGGYSVLPTRLLQHGSNLLGLTVVGWVAWRRAMSRSRPGPARNEWSVEGVRALLAAGGVGLLVGVVGWLAGAPHGHPVEWFAELLTQVVRWGLPAGVLIILLAAIRYRFVPRRGHRDEPGRSASR